MGLVLDASVTLAWMIERVDAEEARSADEVLHTILAGGAQVPALWFAEVANGVLVAERRGGIRHSTSASFLGLVNALPIMEERTRSSDVQSSVLALGRAHELTAYDATYLELALRTSGTLATFDAELAKAARAAGVRVFGDAV
ncbi:MAG: type II toxin-antitoxin system VapC family toxin [Terracidiphilus sp.]